jgi:hypothetical protein
LDLSRVRKKLAEAQFFLEKMSQAEWAFGDHVQFDYYMSAFLNAGRTVDYRLSHEQKAIYKSWRKSWNVHLTPEENSLIKFMVDDRNDEVHESGSSRGVGQEDIKVGVGSSYSIRKPTYYFTIAGAERGAIEACAAYLALLQRMVAKFEADQP